MANQVSSNSSNSLTVFDVIDLLEQHCKMKSTNVNNNYDIDQRGIKERNITSQIKQIGSLRFALDQDEPETLSEDTRVAVKVSKQEPLKNYKRIRFIAGDYVQQHLLVLDPRTDRMLIANLYVHFSGSTPMNAGCYFRYSEKLEAVPLGFLPPLNKNEFVKVAKYQIEKQDFNNNQAPKLTNAVTEITGVLSPLAKLVVSYCEPTLAVQEPSSKS